ncbi:MAG: PIN domain-containing protein [Anaerolineales bacterium]
MKNEIFLDSAFIIALASKTDAFHEKALQISETLDGKILVTTRAILLEIGNALSKRSFRKACPALLDSLEMDDNVVIVSLSDELFTRGVALYAKRTDKEWGLIDCISFVVMQERGISQALTTDIHFQQAGFETLMRE